ncbi:hypothetical protein CL684_02585 [Candidatus Campbellbacteria bacterium]|nr:hypothetical protein [Candidatus Campbellbacteria bacterium]|tara:strand:- start:601 stop:882 length:282 start_codon:yes stop_codon:yes gene_type:complete
MNKENKTTTEEVSDADIQDELVHEIEELKEEVHKQNSFMRGFWGGIIRGVGYAIGATLLFGLLITILAYIVRTSDASWVQSLADWVQLDEVID